VTRAEAQAEVEVHVDRGYERIARSDFAGAREYFDEALRLDPGCVRAYEGRGLAWHHLRDADSALADYDIAIRLATTESRTFLNRGTIRQGRGEIDEAIADYDEALRLDARSVDARRHRASAHTKKADWARAIDDLSEALRLQPADPAAVFQRASAWLQLGQADKGLADLDEALRLDPRMTEALQRRSALLVELGQPERAEQDLQRARAILTARAAVRGPQKKTLVAALIREHFHPVQADALSVTEREFPLRIRADLQRGLESVLGGKIQLLHSFGVHTRFTHTGLDFVGLLVPSEHDPAVAVPVGYEEVDIGEPSPVRCPKNALWLLESEGMRFAVLLAQSGQYGHPSGLKFQLAVVHGLEGSRITQAFFKHLEDAVLRSESYRGKVLSLDARTEYRGEASGILVHQLKDVQRDELILPETTLALLDRNVVGFVRQREQLARFGLSTRKGILLYGPPGTGKTHTIHYLVQALAGYTTFLITAGQMGLLREYMTLARLLQPSLLVLEDVDLIARDRETMDSACSESLLNVLLNEMDGLQQDADLFFILTTNRPEALERALASRPGRIDQAIEYPLPDDACRQRLVHLYSRGLSVSEPLVQEIVARTGGVSASFIRELMRRSAQFHLERGAASGAITGADVTAALDELIAGHFNRRLLGAEGATNGSNSPAP